MRGRKMGEVIHRATSDSLVALDNPDDGELYTTGDAADVALEHRASDALEEEDEEE